MRYREFTINVPITIKIDGDGDPEVNAPGQGEEDSSELDQNPVMVPPLQQHIELTKAEHGKESPVIDSLTQDTPDIGSEPDATPEIGTGQNQVDQDTQLLNLIKSFRNR